MIAALRFKLHFGPYRTARFRYGAVVQDQTRGRVRIVGLTAGKIPWPIGQRGMSRAPILFAGLVRAVRRESRTAIMHWFGASSFIVNRWRNALGVEANNTGTKRLREAHAQQPLRINLFRRIAIASFRDPNRCAKIATARRGKKRSKHVVEAVIKGPLGNTTHRRNSPQNELGTSPTWDSTAKGRPTLDGAGTCTIMDAVERRGCEANGPDLDRGSGAAAEALEGRRA